MSSPEPGTPEYEAQNKGPWTLITCWAVTGVSTLFVIARVYVRGFLQRKLQQDDWWVIIALVCGYISTALSTLAVAEGNGRHTDTLTVEQQQNVILWTTAAFCPGIMSFGLPKLAVIYLLNKLLIPSKWNRWFLWTMGYVCLLSLLATVGVLIGRCYPARSLWDFSVEGECFDPDVLVGYCIYAGSISAFVDLWLAFYPAFTLFKLQMPLKKKMVLTFALGLGSVSGVIAIYKTTRIPALKSPDFAYDSADLVVWTVIEGSAIIMACSIPLLQPLAEKIASRTLFNSGKDSKYRPRYYVKQDEGSNMGDYELGQRKPRSLPKDDLEMTILPDDDNDSQREILQRRGDVAGGRGEDEVGVSVVPAGLTGRSSQVLEAGDSRILRTDVISVEYSDREARGRPTQ